MQACDTARTASLAVRRRRRSGRLGRSRSGFCRLGLLDALDFLTHRRRDTFVSKPLCQGQRPLETGACGDGVARVGRKPAQLDRSLRGDPGRLDPLRPVNC
jgi:hypothetical protein